MFHTKDFKEIIEFGMVLIMLITIIGLVVRAIVKDKSIGARTVQFLCCAFFLPCIIILSLECMLKSETVATLLGGMIGYVLSGISKYDEKPKKEQAS